MKITNKVDALGRRKILWDKVKATMAADELTSDQLTEVVSWNLELDAIGAALSMFNQEEKELAEAEAAAEGQSKEAKGGGDDPFNFDIARWNELYDAGRAEALKGHEFEVGMLPFLFDAPVTTTNWAPESTRFRGVVLQPIRQPSLLDALPTVQVNQKSAVYMRQGAETNSVATRAENAAAAEQEFAAAQVSTVIPTVSAYTEVTGEEMEDEPTILSIIRNRLPILARVAVDSALITAAKGVTGINTTTTAAMSVRLTEILDGFTDIGAAVQTEADIAVCTLKTYAAVRKIRNTTGDYYFGGPAVEGAKSFWGIPVIINNGMTNHEILQFASQAWTAVALKGGAKIYMTDAHGSNFTKNVHTLRVDLAALGLWYHAKAITLLDITLGADVGYTI